VASSIVEEVPPDNFVFAHRPYAIMLLNAPIKYDNSIDEVCSEYSKNHYRQ
jgi:hypothetical protein